ncbi:MAG: hypothetical protein AAFP90_03815 [Planctomycetota bacterium]
MTWMQMLPRFRRASESLAEMADRESWDRDRIAAFQLERINRVWKHARQSVPFYQAHRTGAEFPDVFASLQQYTDTVPVLDKQVVRQTPEDFLSANAQSGCWHRTGGSTGDPMGVYWSNAAHREMLQCKYRSEQKFGLDIFHRKVFFWGHRGSYLPGWKGVLQRAQMPVIDWLRNRLRVSAYQLGVDDLREQLLRIQRFSPASIYGYSSAVSLLAAASKETGIRIPSLKLAVLTAEPADELICRQTAADLGIAVAQEYGSVECGVMAFSDPDGTLRLREDVNYVETLRREDGRYDIVVTVLNNPSFPLMRYRIEDVTDEPRNIPEYGFASIRNIAGRNNDVLVSRNGRTWHSMAIKHLFENFDGVRRFRAHQHEDGSLTVLVETPERLMGGMQKGQSKGLLPDFQAVEKQLRQMLDGFPVTLEFTDKIEGNLAGKHRWIVSDHV